MCSLKPSYIRIFNNTLLLTKIERILLKKYVIDAQTNTLSANRKYNLRSKIQWFTELCNSHDVSHFAAFFIDRRTKVSVVKSFTKLLNITFFKSNINYIVKTITNVLKYSLKKQLKTSIITLDCLKDHFDKSSRTHTHTHTLCVCVCAR